MKTRLLKGVEDDQKAEVRAHFKEALSFRRHLTRVLNEDIESLQRSMLDESLYDTPNWALLQADKIAQVKALRKVISLLDEKTSE